MTDIDLTNYSPICAGILAIKTIQSGGTLTSTSGEKTVSNQDLIIKQFSTSNNLQLISEDETADSISIQSAGGIDTDSGAEINIYATTNLKAIASSQIEIKNDTSASADSIKIHSSAGSLDIDAKKLIRIDAEEEISIDSLTDIKIGSTAGTIYLGKSSSEIVVDGNLTVQGTTTYLNMSEISIKDNFFSLNKGNTTYDTDIGLCFQYQASDEDPILYNNIFYNNSNGYITFADSSAEPTTSVTVSEYIPIKTGAIESITDSHQIKFESTFNNGNDDIYLHSNSASGGIYLKSSTNTGATSIKIESLNGSIALLANGKINTNNDLSLDYLTNVTASQSKYFYIGNPANDNSWRFSVNSGTLVFEKRISSAWVIKSEIL